MAMTTLWKLWNTTLSVVVPSAPLTVSVIFADVVCTVGLTYSTHTDWFGWMEAPVAGPTGACFVGVVHTAKVVGHDRV